MASGLFDMLSDLAKDPALLAKFKADPNDVMKDYDISNESKKHVTSSVEDGKHHDFLKAVGDEAHDQFSDPDMMIC